jgi:hypothetical protein
MNFGFCSISIDTLDYITRFFCGEDLIRLFLCGSKHINTLLVNGGVTSINTSLLLPCGHFNRGKRVIWPNLSFERPSLISLSFSRFLYLRSLQIFVPNIEKLCYKSWLGELESLESLEVFVSDPTSQETFNPRHFPPNITSLGLHVVKNSSSMLMGCGPRLFRLNSIPTLTKITLSGGWQFTCNELNHLSPTLTSIDDLLLPNQWITKQSSKCLPPHLQTLNMYQMFAISLPKFLSSPDFLPSSLTSLEAKISEPMPWTHLPLSLTCLKLTVQHVNIYSMNWHPTNLLTFHLWAPRLYIVNSEEQISSPLYDWLYKNRTINNLKLHSFVPKHCTQQTHLDLDKLPTSITRLSFGGGSSSDIIRDNLPSNFPSGLVSLKLGSTIEHFVRYDSKIDSPQQTIGTKLETLNLSFKQWKLSISTISSFSRLKSLTLHSIRKDDLDEIVDLATNTPTTLKTLDLRFETPIPIILHFSAFIRDLPSSLTEFHTNITAMPTTTIWPPNLTKIEMPNCKILFSASITILPVSIRSIKLHTVFIIKEEELEALQSWMDTHPQVVLDVSVWALPLSLLPANLNISNPIKLHQHLSSMKSFKNNNWLAHMNWQFDQNNRY